MKIVQMKDSDWDDFEKFISKNFSNLTIKDPKFYKHWFRKKNGRWSIQLLKRNDNSIALVNMLIETKAIFFDKIVKFVWTSAAFAERDARKAGFFGIIMFNLHRSLPLIGSTCANNFSLPINKSLGFDIQNLKLRRFVYIHNIKCLNIIKKVKRSLVKKQLKFVKLNNSKHIITKKIKKFPKDTNKLWEAFSKNFVCCINKNYKYLNNRYLKSPHQDYKILSFRNNKKLVGIAVIRFQKTSKGICARIVEFMALKNYEKEIWNKILVNCENNKCIFTDFFVMGTNQDKYLIKTGFKLVTNKNHLDNIPNLLSPIDYRQWSNTFHLGGILVKKRKDWRNKKLIWFTKGDGDRDFPTRNDLRKK